MNRRYDLIIAGAEAAGTMAALKAKESGLNLCVLEGGGGETQLSSGLLHFASPTEWDDYYRINNRRDLNLDQRIKRLIERNPEHPYAKVAEIIRSKNDNGGLSKAVRAVVEAFDDGEDESYWKGTPERSIELLTSFGAYRWTDYCLPAFYECRRENLNSKSLLITGFKQYPEFSAGYISAFLKEKLQNSLSSGSFSKSVKACELELDDLKNSHEIKAAQIARKLDDASCSLKIAEKVKTELKSLSNDVDMVIFPCVLGLERHEECLQILENELNKSVAEIVSPFPGAAGIRIKRRLEKMLMSAGIPVLRGRIASVKFNTEGDGIEAVCLRKISGAELIIEADAFIFAVGRFAGTELNDKGAVCNKLLNLELQSRDGVLSAANAAKLSHPSFFGKQPLFSSGIWTDGMLRPVDDTGKVIWKNVMLAGSVLSGYDPVEESCGLGTALLTGYAAGLNVPSLFAGGG